jgi:5S rRNA maturation endonuclease (ribonuclease M5)
MDALKKQTIVLCEGEKDCILMNQVLDKFGPDDWAAITGTGGASTFRDAWAEQFEGKDVIIIYDRDAAGIAAAGNIASKLVRHALSVKVVTLDITEPAGADITNYFQDSGKGWDDLDKLIKETEEFTSSTPRTRVAKATDDTVYEPHLSEASEERYAHKNIKLKVMVAGKELAPFIVPKDIAYECDMSMGKLCDNCSMFRKNGVIEHTFDDSDPTLVEMVRLSKYELSTFIKRQLKINKNCPIVKETVDAEQNLEEVTLVPELDFSDTDKEYVSRTAYISKHGVQANRSYTMLGTTLPHPRTQHAVHFMPRIEPAQDSIDDFKLEDKTIEALKVFRPMPGQTVESKMEEIALDLSLNVTKIYGRNDLIKAVELCYHTVLAFDFLGKAVEKTWGDILIIGDTRTGKTETVQALIYHYKLGEMSMGENTSFAGLVGGLKQGANRQWSIHWGRIPLNNRRLLVVDEMSGLPLEVISNMSGIRSNGIAEMVKIETQRTSARTRLIWLSNPRADKSMSQYGYGVEAVKELVGRPEDIARFDFVVTSATNEVPVEEINALTHAQVEHKYTSDLCRVLVLWAWSRKAKHIVFSTTATQLVLDLATEQSKKYVSDGGIPLVEGGNHRIKIAKLAVAAACRMFSTDDGERVLVEDQHVQFAADFLDSCYSKASLDYAGWSATRLAARIRCSSNSSRRSAMRVDSRPTAHHYQATTMSFHSDD